MKKAILFGTAWAAALVCLLRIALAAEGPATGVAAKTVGPATATTRPALKVDPLNVDPRQLLQRVLKANAPWLRRQMYPHSYTILTQWPMDKLRHLPEAWEAIVEYEGPDHVSVRSGSVPCDEEHFPPYAGRLDGTYYEQQLM